MSRAATWAAAATALGLALVFSLLLVLLASLLCSLLRQRRRHHSSLAAKPREDPPGPAPSKPLDPNSFPFYAHGVLQAPTSLLLTVPNLEAAATAQQQAPPKQAESMKQGGGGDCGSYQFVYISNPIYDGACGTSDMRGGATPFETPGTSPSCLGIEAEDEEETECSPPLSVMKKLPQVLPKASLAVCLVDGRRSLATSASATDTNRPSSSCSSNSLCSSPPW